MVLVVPADQLAREQQARRDLVDHQGLLGLLAPLVRVLPVLQALLVLAGLQVHPAQRVLVLLEPPDQVVRVDLPERGSQVRQVPVDLRVLVVLQAREQPVRQDLVVLQGLLDHLVLVARRDLLDQQVQELLELQVQVVLRVLVDLLAPQALNTLGKGLGQPQLDIPKTTALRTMEVDTFVSKTTRLLRTKMNLE